MGKFKESIENMLLNLPEEKIIEGNKKEHERAEKEYNSFVKYYKKGECSICKQSLYNFSSSKPCLHYLLRTHKKFKKKNFKDIYGKWGYANIAAYLRWVSNQERFIGNINDLESEKGRNKKFEYTIKWKNIEWTFSCAHSDYEGHSGLYSNFPHYHFQMKIGGQIFIKFGSNHIKFTDYDLFTLEMIENEKVKHGWGIGGTGIQGMVDVFDELSDNEKVQALKNMNSTENEEESHLRIQTFMRGKINGDDLNDIFKESRDTGKTINTLLKEKYPENKVQSIVSPTDNLPDISNRERGRGKNKE